MYKDCLLAWVIFSILLYGSDAISQEYDFRAMIPAYSKIDRERDSVIACKLPFLPFPEQYRNRSLPPVVDNSLSAFWPGIRDQHLFYSCQQHCGVGYVFSYEINRMRNLNAVPPENCYQPHYTWNFMNRGDRYTGVNFIQSFEVIKQQGHMNAEDYGYDTVMSYLGWVSGYDKYYRGMSNRLKQVFAIKVNCAEGINQLRNYLYDHLDGSSTGGIVCFTTSSGTLYNMPQLPAGTPEEGKNVILWWQPAPVHGMTVVGYNDSIRFDVNQDGKYTNNQDINGDGQTDARDWEIGGFKIANSYGGWWSDEGYVYALYSSFALDYPYGGVWNDRVYVAVPDTGYRPSLTVKVNISYNSRNRIRLLAGVSTDTTRQMPDHILDFPVFNFQGGDHFMQGNDSIPDGRTLELGLDVTPLLNHVPADQPARYFFMVEENDPDQQGTGTLNQVTFINYHNGVREFPVQEAGVAIADNGLTLVSAVAACARPAVVITTNSLPPFNGTQPYQVQLEATGGTPPYNWSLDEQYISQPSGIPMPPMNGSSIQAHQEYKSFVPVALPFSFPFYGRTYDTIYINDFGFITFEPQFLPEPYVTDEMNMLETFPLIAPAFSQNYAYVSSLSDGIWFHADAGEAVIRWRVSVAPYYTSSSNDFALVLYPDGKFAFRYGTMNNQNFTQKVFRGVSKGDDKNHNLEIQWDANDLAGKGWKYYPPLIPAGAVLAENGILNIAQRDTTKSYSLQVRVADAGRIEDSKVFNLSDGLIIEHQVESEGDPFPKPGKPASIEITITNQGVTALDDLHLFLRSADTLVLITDSLLSVPLLAPGQTLTFAAAFSIVPSHLLVNDYPLMMTVHTQTGGKYRDQEISLVVGAPVIVVESPVIMDGDDGLLDPGEIADLVVPVRNSGWLATSSLELKLNSRDSTVKILSQELIPIGQLNPSSLNEYRFQLMASRSVSAGESDTLILSLSDPDGEIQSKEIILQLGKKPVALVNLAVSNNSKQAMMNALDSLDVGFDEIGSLPFDYQRYSSIFLILGTSTSGSHTLTIDEAASLTGYLQKNGKLYMEGYNTWYYLNKTPLHPYFKYTSQKVPVYFYPSVTGVQQTFTDSMVYDYGSTVNYAIFDFEPKSPAYATLTNTDVTTRNVEIVYDGTDYKTIGTFLDFSAMNGNGEPASQTTLMKRYLDFFDINTTGPFPLFHASQTTACLAKPVVFTDDSFDNISGRTWEFEGGEPATSAEVNPTVAYPQTGKFDVKLTVTDGVRTKTILKKDYIRVDQCAGIAETDPGLQFRIYPNPSTGIVNVEVVRPITGNGIITVLDLTGRKLYEFRCRFGPEHPTVSIQLTGLMPGMYILMLQHGGWISTKKLVVE